MTVKLRRTSTLDARFVRLEGQEERCLMVFPSGEVPEELIVNFDTTDSKDADSNLEIGRAGRVTFRLQPSSLGDSELIYVEVFDE